MEEADSRTQCRRVIAGCAPDFDSQCGQYILTHAMKGDVSGDELVHNKESLLLQVVAKPGIWAIRRKNCIEKRLKKCVKGCRF